MNISTGLLLTCSVFSRQVFKFRKVPLRSKQNLPEIHIMRLKKGVYRLESVQGRTRIIRCLEKKKERVKLISC